MKKLLLMVYKVQKMEHMIPMEHMGRQNQLIQAILGYSLISQNKKIHQWK